MRFTSRRGSRRRSETACGELADLAVRGATSDPEKVTCKHLPALARSALCVIHHDRKAVSAEA